jgi:hypothetical protein
MMLLQILENGGQFLPKEETETAGLNNGDKKDVMN